MHARLASAIMPTSLSPLCSLCAAIARKIAPLPAACSTKGQGRQKKRGCYLACEDHASQAFAAIAMTSTLNASSHVVRHGALPPGVGWVFENVTR